jgi:CubicO group peptidase (beta-lactamase class C family)
MPAGGLFSTAHDAMCFMQMMLNNGAFRSKQILSEASVHEMTRVQNNNLEGTPYGFGLNIGHDKYGHSGAFKTSMQAFPKSGTILIFMVQISGDFNTKVLRQLEPVAEKLVTTTVAK